jgi:hypothetical protein
MAVSIFSASLGVRCNFRWVKAPDKEAGRRWGDGMKPFATNAIDPIGVNCNPDPQAPPSEKVVCPTNNMFWWDSNNHWPPEHMKQWGPGDADPHADPPAWERPGGYKEHGFAVIVGGTGWPEQAYDSTQATDDDPNPDDPPMVPRLVLGKPVIYFGGLLYDGLLDHNNNPASDRLDGNAGSFFVNSF